MLDELTLWKCRAHTAQGCWLHAVEGYVRPVVDIVLLFEVLFGMYPSAPW